MSSKPKGDASGTSAPALPADAFGCEVQALLDAYFGPRAVPREARKLIVRAALLRRDWLAAEARCMERHLPERRAGSPERIAADASRQAMAALLTAARELGAVLVRH